MNPHLNTGIEGTWAVVTGGSNGIGLGIARAFAAEGRNVLIVGKDSDEVDDACKELTALGTEIVGVVADLTVSDEALGLTATVLQRLPYVDVLVNNVGLIKFTPLADVSPAEFDDFITCNVKTAYFLTQGLLARLEERRGSVINLTSYFANKMIPNRPSSEYSLTKGAMVSFTKALAFELGPQRVRVNAIAPGTVDTPGRTIAIAQMSPEEQRELAVLNAASYPAGRIGDVADVARAAVFLADPRNTWLTGSILTVDGGLTTG
jgi:NAD(P)-dependent dehydrogenase (short-subunit alcohol dehydrogenase family)